METQHPAQRDDDIPSARPRQYAPWLAASFALALLSTLDPVFGDRVTPVRALVLAAAGACAVPGLRRLLMDGQVRAANRRRWLYAIAGIHLVATLFFLPAGHLADPRPIVTADHAVHYGQCLRARDVFRDSLRLDCYNPYFMAGYPAGTVFDIDMKGAELFTALLPLPVAASLKLFILFAYLVMLPAAYRGARMLGFRVEESAVGVMLLLAYWHWGRPYASDFRFVGMFSFVFATHAVLYLTGLVRRFLDGERARTLFILGPVVFVVHVLTVVMALVPVVAVLAADRSRLTRRRAERLFLWGLVVLAANALWIYPLARFLPDKVPTEVYYQLDGLRGLWAVLVEPAGAVALSLFVLAAGGALRLHRDGRWPAAVPCAATVLAMLSLAAFGIHLPGVDQLEPGRFLFTAIVFAAPLAGAGAEWLIASVVSRAGAARGARVREAVMVALALAPLPLAMLDAKAYYHHTLAVDLPPRVEQLRRELVAVVRPGERLMIEEGSAAAYDGTFLPALLPSETLVEQIGGPFPHTPLIHHLTSFDAARCLGVPFAQWDPAKLAARMRFLRVRWIVTATPAASEFVAGLGGVHPVWKSGAGTIWRVDGPPVPYEAHATYNEIDVELPVGSIPVVIPYHWVEGLHAAGGNEIVPVLREGDPVPFVCIRRVRVSPVVITY